MSQNVDLVRLLGDLDLLHDRISQKVHVVNLLLVVLDTVSVQISHIYLGMGKLDLGPDLLLLGGDSLLLLRALDLEFIKLLLEVVNRLLLSSDL